MIAEERAGLLAYRFASLPSGRIDALVSTRTGGTSSGRHASLNLGMRVDDDYDSVLANRRRLFDAFSLDLDRSVWCRQIHRDVVRVVTVADAGRGALTEDDIIPDTDALVTDVPGVTLAVTLADCVPIVIYDPDQHVLGLAHAGWGGTVRRLASRTVQAMSEHWGSDAAGLIAGVGPSIAADEYEVGEDVAAQARDAYGDATHILRTRPNGRYSFDLWAANVRDLIDAGVRRQRIEVAGVSTAAHLDQFYSHRVEGATGRFVTVATLKPSRHRQTPSR